MQPRTVIIEEALRPRLEALLPTGKDYTVSTGLLLAQTSSDSSFWILGIVPTPLKDETPEGEEEQEEVEPQKSPPSKTNKKELDESWIAKHALEVGRMLTGGVYIAGVYVLDNSSVKRDDTSVCGLLDVIVSNLPSYLLPSYFSTEETVHPPSWIGLRYDWKASKFAAKMFAAKSNGELDYSSGWPASELKFQSFVSSFQTLVCKYPVSLEVNLEKGQHTIEQQLKESINQAATNILNSICVVNGKAILKTHKELVSALGVAKMHDVDICSTWVTPAKRKIAHEHPVVAQMRINIQISGVAFSLPSEPLSFATQALKKDIVSSLHCRIELLAKELLWKQDLLDSLQRDSTAQPDEIFNLFKLSCASDLKYQNTMWMLPNRVLVPFNGPVCLCDYIFPYETKMDAIERYSALLSLPAPDTPDDWLIVLESTTAAVGDLDQPPLVSTPQNVLKRRHSHQLHHTEANEDDTSEAVEKPKFERRTSVPKIETGRSKSLTALFYPLLLVLCVYTIFLLYLGLNE